MASTAWIGTDVKVTSGSRTVEVTRNADTDDISKVKVNGNFVASNFSLPYEVERTYTTGETDFIVLKELWQGASGSGLNAVVATSPATIEEARLALVNLISIYESFADNVSPAVTADSVVQRTANGRIKATAGVAADEVVVQSQLGTAASKNTGTVSGNIMEVGAFDLGAAANASTLTTLPSDTVQLPTRFGRGQLDNGVFTTFVNMRGNLERQTQLHISYGGNTRGFLRSMGSNNVWNDDVEIYHTGNSVNPLDYGLGLSGATPTVPNLDTQQETGLFRISDANAVGLPEIFLGTLIQNNRDSVRRNQIIHNELEMFFRGESSSGFQEWNKVYHSGNSANPLDLGWGIKGVSRNVDNFDSFRTDDAFVSGAYRYSSTTVGRPTELASHGTALFMSRAANDGTLLVMDYAGNVASKAFDNSGGVSGHLWNIFYHSGNSVNPLDYGLGEAAPTKSGNSNTGNGFFRNAGDEGWVTSTASQFPYIQSSRSTLGDTVCWQFGAQVSGGTGDNNPIFQGRVTSASNGDFGDIVTFLHNGNTNFNVLKGNSAGDTIAQGYMATDTVARFLIPICQKEQLFNSITVQGTFAVRQDNGVVNSGISASNIGLHAGTSYKIARIEVTGLTGTAGRIALLELDSAASQITLNT